MFESINPHTSKNIHQFSEMDDQEADIILNRSQNAFEKWKLTNFSLREEKLKSLAQTLRKNKIHYAKMIALEMGKPIQYAEGEIEKCATVCEYYAKNASVFLQNELVKTEASESLITYEPIGTVLAIMPWNYPFWQVFRFAAPALMSGNVAVLKHAPNVFGCATLIEECFAESGFPDGVFQNLFISHQKIDRVIQNSIVKAVTLTGSERAGAAVAAQAGRAIKKSVLELGGSNAFIVLQDADIKKAVEVGLWSRMQNSGQSCIAAKRFFLHKDIATQYLELFKEELKKLIVGDPLIEGTHMGPMARLDLAIELEGQLKDTLQAGAKLFYGGNRRGAHFEPTMVTEVQPGMTAFDQELFGPVAAFTIVDNAEEGINLSNRSELGLGVSIFTQNIEEAKRLIPMVEDGAVFINAMVKSDPRLPFGGTKKSGYGRELSIYGIREFVNIKTVYIA